MGAVIKSTIVYRIVHIISSKLERPIQHCINISHYYAIVTDVFQTTLTPNPS